MIEAFQLDFSGALSGQSVLAIFTYVLIMVCDIGGSIHGLGNLAGLVTAESREVEGSAAVFLSASLGSAIGAWTGISPLIITAESAVRVRQTPSFAQQKLTCMMSLQVGIKEGGRTGLVPCTVGLCFAASLFLSPLIQSLPLVTTAPVLVIVGALMMGEAGHVDWSAMSSAVPAFLTIVIQPFTYSIANGVYVGLGARCEQGSNLNVPS